MSPADDGQFGPTVSLPMSSSSPRLLGRLCSRRFGGRGGRGGGWLSTREAKEQADPGGRKAPAQGHSPLLPLAPRPCGGGAGVPGSSSSLFLVGTSIFIPNDFHIRLNMFIKKN